MSKEKINDVELDKINSLVKKFCNFYEDRPQGDAYYDFHGFMTALLHEAIEYGRSIGKQESVCAQALNEYLIQPENDRAWQEELEAIQKDTDTHDLIKQTKLLSLIAEMLLYRRRGG